MSLRLIITLAVLLFAAACSPELAGDPTTTAASGSASTTTVAVTTTSTPPTTQPTTTTLWDGPPRYEYVGTVSQDPGADPMMCFGFYDLFAPPHCDGFPVLGLDWDEVPGANTSTDTTWATLRLVGTFDGTVFTVTQPPEEPAASDGTQVSVTFDTPCPTPAEGWRIINLETATGESRVQAKFYAEAQHDFAGLWLSRPPSAFGEVLVIGFTGRIVEHREHLESIYGGPMCVAKRDRTVPELDALAGELYTLLSGAEAREHGIWVPSIGPVLSRRFYTSPPLEAIVFAITSPDAQDWVTEHFGEGTVSLRSVLIPVGGG